MHLIKLCVGVESVEHLAALQDARLKRLRAAGQPAELVHRTRQTPRQRDAILKAGGSLYWVIKGAVRARQKILDLREETGAEGTTGNSGDGKLCGIVLAPELIATRPQPRRAFQGWRYLKPEDAPADTGAVFANVDLNGDCALGAPDEAIPAIMRAQLTELALI